MALSRLLSWVQKRSHLSEIREDSAPISEGDDDITEEPRKPPITGMAQRGLSAIGLALLHSNGDYLTPPPPLERNKPQVTLPHYTVDPDLLVMFSMIAYNHGKPVIVPPPFPMLERRHSAPDLGSSVAVINLALSVGAEPPKAAIRSSSAPAALEAATASAVGATFEKLTPEQVKADFDAYLRKNQPFRRDGRG